MVKPYTDENLEVHVDEADEGENPSGEGGVPDQGEGVPDPIIVIIIIIIIISSSSSQSSPSSSSCQTRK